MYNVIKIFIGANSCKMSMLFHIPNAMKIIKKQVSMVMKYHDNRPQTTLCSVSLPRGAISCMALRGRDTEHTVQPHDSNNTLKVKIRKDT